MATGLVSTRPTKVGDVIKHEYLPSTGYCRILGVVAVPAAGIAVGTVVEKTSVEGKWTPVVTATAADAAAIVVDTTVNDSSTKDGDFLLALLNRGPAQVADASLSFGAITPAAKLTAFAALTAKGIEVLEQA